MSKWFLWGFLSGAVLGSALGFLTAPVRGSAIRDRLKDAAYPAHIKLSGLRVNFKAWADSASEAIKQSI